MTTQWVIRFVDGSSETRASETIQDAMNDAEFETGKYVRSATLHLEEVYYDQAL